MMLAAWMRGAVFAALDIVYPEERLDYIAMDCGAKVRVNAEFLDGLATEEPVSESADVIPSDPALLIYTSGSTGRPKGVLLSHQSIHDSCVRGVAALKANEYAGEYFGAAIPFSFVVGIQVTLGALMAGMTVSVVPYDVVRDPVRLSAFIAENDLNIIFLPPKLLKVFRPQGDCLHTVITGSEKVSDVYRTDFRLVVSYGSSESAGGVLFFDIDRSYDNTPIGKPVCIEGVCQESAYILDEDGKEADEGELCLSGHFALEYLNQPEATAKILVPNPFRDKDGNDILLRTGDIVRRLPDGNILYLNRKDWMIKISGQRVEPGEIEQALRTVSGVRDVTVRDFENSAGQTYICAFYVRDPEKNVVEDDLRSAVRSRLPEYMMPAFFVELEALPLNANGKQDRSALKAPDAAAWTAEYIAPRNETEQKLCDAFASVLDVPRVGIDDDFFRMGGDSIRVMMLQNECTELMLSTRMIYDCRTPRKLAEELSEAEPEADSLQPGEIPAEPIPLTQTQLGICLESEKREGEAAYNNPMLFRIPADTDADRLSKAISTALKAHPALFVRIVTGEDGMPAMQYEPDFLQEEICGIVSLTEKELTEQKKTLVQPFLIRKDRLFRCRLYKTEEDLHLFMDFHHIIFDGTSMHILFADIEKAFRGENVKAEEYTALDEQRDRSSEAYQNAAGWYRKTFEDFEEVSLPSGDKAEKAL
ncbi:MAG: AMP-binding protein [Blautia sp.]|nr:AMP-binding protein [Blautia sp.]